LATSTSLGTTQINATSDGISSPDQTLTVFKNVSVTIIPYMDYGYKYKIVNQEGGVGFEKVNYNDSSFSTGDASFGSINPTYCKTYNVDMYSSKYIRTPWPLFTDILLRKEFSLPADATNLRVYVAVDNDVRVFINGHDVSNGMQVHDSSADWDSLEFSVNNSILKTGTNLLAVRGRDRGRVCFLDIRIAVDISKSQAVKFKKFTNGEDANEAPGPFVSPGSNITWTYNVTNIGNVTFTSSNISVTDNDSTVIPVYVSGDTNNDGNLESGETWVYSANGTAIVGQYANTGRATIMYNGTKLYFEDPSHYYGRI
jgi:hypothetical protein